MELSNYHSQKAAAILQAARHNAAKLSQASAKHRHVNELPVSHQTVKTICLWELF